MRSDLNFNHSMNDTVIQASKQRLIIRTHTHTQSHLDDLHIRSSAGVTPGILVMLRTLSSRSRAHASAAALRLLMMVVS